MYQQPQTMVRTYSSQGAYQHDANHLAREGWRVQSVTESRPNIGCARGCLLGLWALVFRPKNKLIVTYVRP